jgi:hypothetical protein
MAIKLRQHLFTRIEASDVPLCTLSGQRDRTGYYRKIIGLWGTLMNEKAIASAPGSGHLLKS